MPWATLENRTAPSLPRTISRALPHAGVPLTPTAARAAQQDPGKSHPEQPLWCCPRRDRSPLRPQAVTLSPLLCCDRQTSPCSQDHQLFTHTISEY